MLAILYPVDIDCDYMFRVVLAILLPVISDSVYIFRLFLAILCHMWSLHVTAVCWHQSTVHGAQAFFYVSVLLCDNNLNGDRIIIFPMM